jgi:hypothetical protein
MGQDMYHLSQQIAIQSHAGLVIILRKVREQLAADEIGGWDELIAEIDQQLNNASIR